MRTESVHDQRSDETSRRRQQPWLVNQFSEIDTPSTGPSTLQTYRHNYRLGIEDFSIHLILVHRVSLDDHEVDIPGFEFAVRSGLVHANELEDDSRVARRKEIDHGRYNAGECWIGAPDTNHSDGWVSNALNLLQAFLQIVEHGDAAFERGPTIIGQVDTAHGSVEQTHTERALQSCDRLG